MNFLAGKIVRQSGLTFVCRDDQTTFSLPEGFAPAAAHLDADLVLGIRPEHLDVVNGGGAQITTPVQVIESLGNETLLYLNVAGNQLTVRAGGNLAAAMDQNLGLSLRAENIHLFATDDSGSNLAL